MIKFTTNHTKLPDTYLVLKGNLILYNDKNILLIPLQL